VLQEQRDLPHLRFGERGPVGRHPCKADSVSDLPVDRCFGIVLDSFLRQLRRVWCQSLGDGRCGCICTTVADLTVLDVQSCTRREVGLGRLKRTLQQLCFTTDGCSEGCLCGPCLQPSRLLILSCRKHSHLDEHVPTDGQEGDRDDNPQ
jgi:hypothetical protein